MVYLMARPIKRRESRFPQAREVVPAEVRGILGRTEFRLALHGATAADNRRLHAEAIAKWEAQIAAARATLHGNVATLTARQIDAIGGEWYRDMMALHEDEPGDEEGWDIWRELLLEWTQEREADDNSPFEPTKADIAEATDLIFSKGIAADAKSIHRLAGRMLSIKLHLIDLMKRRANGDWRPDPRVERFPPFDPALFDKPPQTRGKSSELTFRDLLAKWAAERQPARNTIKLYTIAFKHIARILGFDDARRMTVADVRTYKEARLSEGRNVGTVADEVLAAHSVFKWAVQNQLLPSNPFTGMAPRSTKRASGEGKGYTDVEAAQLLQAARNETGWKRWLPWLLCFSGARISELAELRVKDIRREAGVWILDIAPTETRAGKTPSFQRMLPIHPALVAEGFLAYATKLPEGGPLFPDLKPDREGSRRTTATTNFGRWVRGRGGLAGSKKQPSHGFRHRMEDQLRRARVQPEVFDAITGRNNPRNAGVGYGAGFRRMPDETIKELSRIPSPLVPLGASLVPQDHSRRRQSRKSSRQPVAVGTVARTDTSGTSAY